VLDFSTCSKAAFDDAVVALITERTQRKASGHLPANPFGADGWYDITPGMSHDALLLSSGNRSIAFLTVRTYATDMADGHWMPTTEAIGFAQGELDNGHHRFFASYLGGHTFRSFVITSGPQFDYRFAYYDQGKRRSVADSLYIGGWNGASRVIATMIAELAVRYEAGMLGVAKQPRFRKPSPSAALHFMHNHSDLRDSARYILANHAEAINMVQSKPAAIFFGHLIMKHYGEPVLDDFFHSLALGANLAEDSVMLALRNRLLAPEPEGQETPARGRLALLIKGFKLHMAGEVMPRSRGRIMGMSFPDPGQPFPRIEPPPENP
jgi:hypothetical protein